MKKNRKNSTKSLLACAVLASVLGGGMVPSVAFAVEQEQLVNAVFAPKDLISKSITFGQKRGYVENQAVTYPDGIPTWQIVAGDNGSISLLANQAWGYNRFSDKEVYHEALNPGATTHQLFYREVLKYLNDNVSQFFTADELNLLQKQTSVEEWHKFFGHDFGKTEYSGIFALPTTGQVNALTAEQRKRANFYWLADGYTYTNFLVNRDYGRDYGLYYKASAVQSDGSIVPQAGENAKHIYPTIALNKPLAFAYCMDKEPGDTFKSQNVSEPSTISLKNFTFKDTDKEKNVNITKLSVTQDTITFDANGLATGAGQGIGGLVEDADGNYLAYARLKNSVESDGTVNNVEIKFNDTTITGNNTIHLFNEWLGDSYGLAGNYEDLNIDLNNNQISVINLLEQQKPTELTIGDGVQLKLSVDRIFRKLTIGNGEFTYTAVNIPGGKIGGFYYTECQAVKVTEALNWANVLQAEGEIILKGSFSVEDGTLTLVRPTNTDTDWKWGITGWNDLTYNGTQSATLKVKGNMHGLIVSGGTFTAQDDLTLEDYLRVNNGAVVNLGGNVTTNNVNLNGTLNIITADKTISVKKSLTASDGAKIAGTGSAKLEIGENLTAQGDLTLENITLDKLSSAEENNIQIQVQGNLSSNAFISANSIEVQGSLSAGKITSKNVTAGGQVTVTELSVSNVLNLANGNEQSGTIGTLTFGDGKVVVYAFDLGKDKFNITNSASGTVKIVPEWDTLPSSGTVDVFTGGNLNDLVIRDVRITDMDEKKTYIFTQNTDNRGKLNVTVAKHNAVANFNDIVKGQKIVFGNYPQDDGDAKQPVVWFYVKDDNGQPVFLSNKVIAATEGDVYHTEMWKITNMLKKDGTFVKDLFTADELDVLKVINEYGDVLGLPSAEDVKSGGNYGWNNFNSRKPVGKKDNYALSSTHYYEWSVTMCGHTYLHNAYINDWVDSTGNVHTSDALEKVYGIRPTISFEDTYSVLFTTNAEGGKGSVAEGQVTRLQDVDGNSTLELTFDDAYIAETRGIERSTGDIALSSVALDGSSVSVDYSNAKYVDGNSFVSLLIGEGNVPLDYFGYGKTKAGTEGNGRATFDLGNFASNTDTNGYALTFFNEQGNGTSFAGKFNVLPGVLKLEGTGTDKYLRYTVVAGDVAQDIEVGKNNVVELTGANTTLQHVISGEGKVLVKSDYITASGDMMQADFEAVSSVMKISGGDVKGSLKGYFTLTADTSFSGKSLQGKITSNSTSSTEKLKLNNDVQVNGNLEIANLDGNGKTLDMRQTTVGDDDPYDELTIGGTLWGDANWAIDVGKYNGTDTFTSDKIHLSDVDTDGTRKKITLTAINLIDDPMLSSSNLQQIISAVVSVLLGGNANLGDVQVANGLRVYGSNIYTPSFEGGNLKLTYLCDNTEGFKGFIKNENNASYSFRTAETLGGAGDLDAVTTGSAVAGTENITKTVFMNDKELRGYGMNNVKSGIIVAETHTLSMTNGTITNFATALQVNSTGTSTGTLVLENVTLWGNTTDVQNDGTMNIRGTVKMDTLTGSGTTEFVSNSILNLGDATATDPQTFEQTFTGYGLLNFMGNTSVAVTKLGTVTDKIAVTIAENKTLSLTGSGTLYNTIKGEGKINIASGNSITTNASNLQADVVNDGTLTIGVDNTGKVVGSITDTAGSGTNGTLVIAKNTIVEGKIAQNNVTVNENATLDVYKDLTANSDITNNGAILIDIDNLKNNVNNSANGAVYLRNLGTAASKTLPKTITNGKVIVMNDVISSLQKLQNTEVCLAGGANLTLSDGGTLEIGINIKGYGSGAGTLITDCNGMAGTDNYYTATFDNIQVPLVNKGILELSAGSPYPRMDKMTSITNSGTLSIGADITLDRNISNSGTLNINGCLFSGEMTNSGTVTFKRVEGVTTSVCTITGTINNSGTVEIMEGNTFDTTAKVIGGILNLKGDYTFSNDNIQGLTELYVNGATYNFKAELGATPSVELIDAEKVTGTLKLGAVTATSNETLSEWELGETKTAQYLTDNTENTVVVDNTAVVFSGDNYRFTFSQAKKDNGIDNKFGYLAIVKENGGELWQIVRNTQVSGYHCGNVTTYSLTGDYAEQLTGTEAPDNTALGTLTRTEAGTPRELTIEGNTHFFAGNGKNGITVGNADDVLNFKNISEIKNWNSYIVTNDGGTVNFNNVTKLSSPVINTSGTVNFNGTTEVNSTLSGNGTFNNNGELTVTDTDYLGIDELINNGIIKINGGILYTKIRLIIIMCG